MNRFLLFYASVMLVILMGVSCTTKEICLVANIDYEFTATAPEQVGFVKDALETQISISPTTVDYPGFEYYLRYEVLEGTGYFINTTDQNPIPAAEDLRLALVANAYPAAWEYIGQSEGQHRVRFFARDNFNRAKETELSYTFNNLALDWSVNAQPTTLEVGTQAAITMQLRNNSTERESDFIVTITNSSGLGNFLDQDQNPIATTSFAIEEGTTELFFVPDTEGEVKLTFVLTDSNGQQLDDVVLLTVTKNQLPVAVDDTALTTPANVPLVLDVVQNDSDPENDPLTITETSPTAAGAEVTINTDGTLTYTPTDPSFMGQDQFRYTITDGRPENTATAIVLIDVTVPIITLAPKVVLQAAMLESTDGLMKDTLRALDYLPFVSPYGDATTITVRSFFMQTGPNAIVDWVLVELRDATDPTQIVASQSALLQRDFDVVDITGASPLQFALPDGNYHVVIKHRNHLGIMSAAAIALQNEVTNVDFSNGSTSTFGSEAQVDVNASGVFGLWAGDANGDGKIISTGSGTESEIISDTVLNDPDNNLFGGPPLPSYESLGYKNTDVDFTGGTRFIGAGVTDVIFIRSNVLLHPNNIFDSMFYRIDAQLP